MEDDVDALAGAQHPVTVADVTDQETNGAPGNTMALIELLGLVSPEDTNDVGAVRDKVIDEARADRP